MAAPAHTARVVPTTFMLPDGYQTTFAFALKPNVSLWEKDLKPFGLDAGGGIPTETMLTKKWRPKRAKHLITTEDISFNAGYDPDVISDILILVGKETSGTIWLPDGSCWDLFCFLDKWMPQDLKEGEMPLASCTVCSMNWDPVNNVEVGPVFVPATGT